MTILLVAGILLTGFGLITLVSIGILLVPIGVAMIVAAFVRTGPALRAGIIAGAVTYSFSFALTAPWGCSQTSEGGSVVTTTCSRIALSDIPRTPQAGDLMLALSIASAAAGFVGIGSAALVRRLAPGAGPSG